VSELPVPIDARIEAEARRMMRSSLDGVLDVTGSFGDLLPDGSVIVAYPDGIDFCFSAMAEDRRGVVAAVTVSLGGALDRVVITEARVTLDSLRDRESLAAACAQQTHSPGSSPRPWPQLTEAACRHAAAAYRAGGTATGPFAVDLVAFLAEVDAEAPPEYLVAGIVPYHGITLIAGHPKSLKTLFVMDVVAGCAAERSVMGREVRGAATLYAGREGSRVEAAKRWRRVVDATGSPRHRIRLSSRDLVVGSGPSWADLADEIAEMEADGEDVLLVLDPLRDIIPAGTTEKDDQAAAAVKRALRELLDGHPRLTIILIHHVVKASNGGESRAVSGSGAWIAMADSIIVWEKQGDEEEDAAAEPDENFDFDAATVVVGRASVEQRGESNRRFGWSWSADTGRFRDADLATTAPILAALAASPAGMTTSEVAAAVWASWSSLDDKRRAAATASVRSQLGRFRSAGRAKVVGSQGRSHIWSLTGSEKARRERAEEANADGDQRSLPLDSISEEANAEANASVRTTPAERVE
jgi:hypothetical protein